MSHFYGMFQYVLSVRSPVFESSQKLYQFRMKIVYSDFKGSLLALFLYDGIYFSFSLFHHLFYPGRMYSSVYYEFFKGYSGYLSPYSIES